MKTFVTALLGVGLAVLPAVAHADVAVVDTTGGSPFAAFALDETVGFTFDVLEDIDVTALGWKAADGNISSNHRVGIWDNSGGLLASAVVNSASPLTAGFGYTSLSSPLRLLANTSYVIGGRERLLDGDTYVSGFSSITTASSISFTGAARSTVLSGFSYPTVRSANLNGRIGPNFEFTKVTAAIPEPATWAMMILGFGVIGGVLRSRRRTTVAVAYAG